MELNKVMMIGNLTRDPELRNTANGTAVCKFDIAVNTKRGKDKDEVLFIRVETWQKTAELADQYLTKGSQVLVEGRLKSEEYETKDGQKRKDVVIVAENIRFGARAKGSEDRGSAPREDRAPQRSREPEPAAAATGGDDDLPF